MSGTVFIEDFDRGMMVTLGARLVLVVGPSGDFTHYVIDVPSVVTPQQPYDGGVPAFFITGNARFVEKYRPCVLVRRQDPQIAFENGGHAWGIQYKRPAAGSSQVVAQVGSQSISGPSHVELLERAAPYKIPYEIQCFARGPTAQRDANRILRHVMRVFQAPSMPLRVMDSEGDEREYDALPEGPSWQSEVLDLTARDIAWTLTLTVHGELDLADPYAERTISETRTNMGAN